MKSQFITFKSARTGRFFAVKPWDIERILGREDERTTEIAYADYGDEPVSWVVEGSFAEILQQVERAINGLATEIGSPAPPVSEDS